MTAEEFKRRTEELEKTDPEYLKALRDYATECKELKAGLVLRWSQHCVDPRLVELLESLDLKELKLLQQFALIVATRPATVRVQ